MSDADDCVDAELVELRELKKKLMKKVLKLRDSIEKCEKSGMRNHTVQVEDLFPNFHKDPVDKSELFSMDKTIARLCDASQSILGVQFKNVEVTWLRNEVYRYEAQVFTKTFQTSLELIVSKERKRERKEFSIEKISCQYVNLDACYLKEITEWTQRFTNNKNFPGLISAISDYSEQSHLRVKILRTLEAQEYISMEKCSENGGGILIYLHPRGVNDKVLFKIQWYLKFINRTWRIEHIFSIDPVQADENFVEEHKQLLESFCIVGLRQKNLQELWSKLTSAIDSLL